MCTTCVLVLETTRGFGCCRRRRRRRRRQRLWLTILHCVGRHRCTHCIRHRSSLSSSSSSSPYLLLSQFIYFSLGPVLRSLLQFFSGFGRAGPGRPRRHLLTQSGISGCGCGDCGRGSVLPRCSFLFWSSSSSSSSLLLLLMLSLSSSSSVSSALESRSERSDSPAQVPIFASFLFSSLLFSSFYFPQSNGVEAQFRVFRAEKE